VRIASDRKKNAERQGKKQNQTNRDPVTFGPKPIAIHTLLPISALALGVHGMDMGAYHGTGPTMGHRHGYDFHLRVHVNDQV
jgi:hypothetical protein